MNTEYTPPDAIDVADLTFKLREVPDIVMIQGHQKITEQDGFCRQRVNDAADVLGTLTRRIKALQKKWDNEGPDSGPDMDTAGLQDMIDGLLLVDDLD